MKATTPNEPAAMPPELLEELLLPDPLLELLEELLPEELELLLEEPLPEELPLEELPELPEALSEWLVVQLANARANAQASRAGAIAGRRYRRTIIYTPKGSVCY